MNVSLRCLYFVLLNLILKPCESVARNGFAERSIRVRVRRQGGYVYDKPSVSFDLPSRSTTSSTQATTVDRTLTQQMYYAYPVPAGGNTVNIGTSATTSTFATPVPVTQTTSDYSYNSPAKVNAGYSYGTTAVGQMQATTASQVTNIASQTGSQFPSKSDYTITDSGYGYNVPLSTLSPSLESSSRVTTKAPMYLPPTTGGTVSSLGENAIVGAVSLGSGYNSNSGTATSPSSIQKPADNYLPPIDTTNSLAIEKTSIDSQTNSGTSISVPSTAYLPPRSSTPLPLSELSSTSQPALPATNYIPSSNSGSNFGAVSTPAAGYLPPLLF